MNVGLFAPLAILASDPAPSLTRSKAWSRQLVCERMSVEAASRLRPGLVVPERPRGDFMERSVVLCTQRALRSGLRAERDEAILSDLDVRASEIATAVAATRPDLAARTWLVEAFYPEATVQSKLAFAAKNALMSQGLPVSDRSPTLAVGDVAVLTRMSPAEAYPAACRRYTDQGGLREGDALLAVVSRDPRETALHAGVCADGAWVWIR